MTRTTIPLLIAALLGSAALMMMSIPIGAGSVVFWFVVIMSEFVVKVRKK